MTKKIKLIWDFRGLDALQKAKHHCIHLQEYTSMEKVPFTEIDHQEISELFSTAYITVKDTEMIKLRDALKPHRGQYA